MNRILKVVRLHLVNRYSVIGLPAMILGIAFTITLLFWLLARTTDSADSTITVYSGAGFSVVIYLLVYAVLAISAMFPFALGFTVTRRDFYLGTCLTLVLLSAGYSFVLVVLSYVEEVTNGWWLNGQIFGTPLFGDTNPIQRWLFYTLTMMLFSAVGMSIATIYMRWRVTGMLAFWAIAAVLVVGGIALVGYTSSWSKVGQWFASNGSLGVALWSLVPTILAAGLGYLILKRATPQS